MRPEPTSKGRPIQAGTPDISAALSDAGRLAALSDAGLMDTAAEPSFDRLARLATRFLGVPVALVSLVDADRQFFKSCVGLPGPWAERRGTPLSHSFCQHVVATGEPLVVPDARLDPDLKENLAIEDIGVVAYLGIPLEIDGQVIGSFCAIDGQPRAWTDGDVAAMSDLAGSVVSEIRLRAEADEAGRQRLAAEEARRHVEVTLASIGDAVITADADARVTFINPAASLLCGWPAEEAVGRPVAEVFAVVEAETGEPMPRYVDRILTSGEPSPWRDHTILLARDGARREIEESGAPILVDGRVVGAVVTFRDVGPRKQQARSLEDARRRLQYTLEAGAVATWTWDIPSDTLVPDANMARLFSIPPEHAGGGPIAMFLPAIHPDDLGPTMVNVNRSLATGEYYEAEYRVIQPDGSTRWVIAKSTPTLKPDGSPESLSGVVIDITDRKRAEETLARSEEKYRTLFGSMDQGYCVLQVLRDAAGRAVDFRFLEVNPAFEMQTGLKDAAGRTMRQIIPDHDEFWFETYGRVAETGEPIRFQQASESMQGEAFDCYAFRIGRPAEQKVAVLFTNITHRLRNQAERESLVNQLVDADRRKDEFLAMLAHELRNPLSAVAGAVHVASRTVDRAQLPELYGTIRYQVRHLTHLIDDLLDVSRITQGKVELRKQTVDLGPAVDRAVLLARPQVDQKRHCLAVALADPSARFVADPVRVEQMLGNLLTNAAKYSDPGRRIDLDVRVEGGEVVFRVRDEGYGISAEMLPKIFGLFEQVDTTIDRSRGGLGIGLALVRSLAEMHGGSVEAESEGEGRGSTFTLRLPVGEPGAEATIPGMAAPPRRPTTAGRVLVVDDNEVTARLTARMLRPVGFEVDVAHDGPSGLELARRVGPAVVLLDIGLPGLNGYEVARRLRADDRCRGSLIVAVSGYGEASARERSKAAGFDLHLTKPLDFDELMAALGKG